MIEARTYGAPNWVDLNTPDLEAATRFYRDLLGWRMERSSTPMGTYVIGRIGDDQVAGMMEPRPEDEPAPPMWTTFFHVADADETVAEAERLRGMILERPFDLLDGARIAVVADPGGGMFGLMAGPVGEGTWMSHQPGRVCWVELLSRDVAAAEPFYESLFGWKAVTQDAGDLTYTMFKLGDDDVAGLMAMPSEVPAEAPSHWAVYFAVVSCTATAERAAALGGTVLRGPTPVGSERFAVLADPQGATFSVLETAGR